MKFNCAEKKSFDWEGYLNYLESIKHQLPAHVFQFASNTDHYRGDSHSSLHDAWLDYFNIIELASGDRMQNRSTEIEARFLGPYHDRRIFIRYREVLGYEFTAENLVRGHGDLLLHELRLGDDSELIHELVFDRDRTLIIRCRDLIHWEEYYSY